MSNLSSTSSYVHTENITVSVIMAVVGVFGLISNGTALLAVRYNPALRNSFGLLCFSHSISNMGFLLVFTFWTAPVTLFGSKLSVELIGKVFGMVILVLWNVGVYSHLAIALNRMIAIAFPMRASFVLTVKNTTFIVLICWMLGLFHITPNFWTESCFFFFDTSWWAWMFSNETCASIMDVYIEFYSKMGVFVLILLLDCTTLICPQSQTHG